MPKLKLSNITTSPDQQVCICSGAQPIRVTVEGGAAAYTFQWDLSRDLSSWSTIPGATAAEYAPPVYQEAGNYYYRCAVVEDGVVIYSSTITIQVDAMPEVNAGKDQAKHNETFFQALGNTPKIGAGLWSAIKGNPSISYPKNPHTNVYLYNDASATLVWTVTNGSCAASDTVVFYKYNYWHGTKNTDWEEPANWTAGVVSEGWDIEFATEKNNGAASESGNGKGEAVNDLVLPVWGWYTINNLINASSKNLVISANSSLTVRYAVEITQDGIPSTDPSKIQIKAEADERNGTLILNCSQQMDTQPDVYATVELYAKGKEGPERTWVDNIAGSPTKGQTFKSSYSWQYFGIPVKSVEKPVKYFHKASIRQYFEDYNGEDSNAYYQKWKPIEENDMMEAFKGYEITQKNPTTYSIEGKLVYCVEQNRLTMTRKASLVEDGKGAAFRYGLGQNIFGNSYTAAIPMSIINFPPEAEETVYLYNTGSFADWAAAPEAEEEALLAGQYKAMPKKFFWRYQIPSMNGFLVKFLPEHTIANGDDAAIIFSGRESGLESNQYPQTVKRKEPSFLHVRLSSSTTIDDLWLVSQEGTTSGFDNGWDGRKSFGTPTAYIYTDTQDGLMQVNADQTIDGTLISFYANKDTEYTLTISKSRLDDYQNLHLIDYQTKTVLPLHNDTTVYHFSATNKGYTEERFQLVDAAYIDLSSERFQQLDGSMLQNGTLQLVNYTSGEGIMRVYDTSGRSIYTDVLPAGVTHRPTSLSRGVYILYLESEGKQTSVKIIVGN